MRFGVALLVGLAAASAVVYAEPRSSPGSPPRSGPAAEATSALARQLKAKGRAIVGFERTSWDPITQRSDRVKGDLVIQPPAQVALSFRDTGEKIMLRQDGGEWVQPRLQQMIRLGPGQAALARQWWDVLMQARSDRALVRRLSARRFLVVGRNAETALTDSAWISLAQDGLPLRLEIADEPGAHTVYRFFQWRFTRPQPTSSFVLRPPPDYRVVELP